MKALMSIVTGAVFGSSSMVGVAGFAVIPSRVASTAPPSQAPICFPSFAKPRHTLVFSTGAGGTGVDGPFQAPTGQDEGGNPDGLAALQLEIDDLVQDLKKAKGTLERVAAAVAKQGMRSEDQAERARIQATRPGVTISIIKPSGDIEISPTISIYRITGQEDYKEVLSAQRSPGLKKWGSSNDVVRLWEELEEGAEYIWNSDFLTAMEDCKEWTQTADMAFEQQSFDALYKAAIAVYPDTVALPRSHWTVTNSMGTPQIQFDGWAYSNESKLLFVNEAKHCPLEKHITLLEKKLEKLGRLVKEDITHLQAYKGFKVVMCLSGEFWDEDVRDKALKKGYHVGYLGVDRVLVQPALTDQDGLIAQVAAVL